MIESIPYVIERELLSGRAVELPFIGVLSTQRRSARFCEHSSMMMPPYDVLVLSADSGATGDVFFDSVLSCFSSLSSEGTSYTIDDIVLLYNSWFTDAQSSGGALLTIDGVCTIGFTDAPVLFSVDKHFEELLSPFSGEAFVIGRPLGGGSRGAVSHSVKRVYPVVDEESVVEPIVEPIVELPPPLVFASGRAGAREVDSIDSFAPPQPPQYHHQPPQPQQHRVKPVKRVATVAIVLAVALFCVALLYIAYSFSKEAL